MDIVAGRTAAWAVKDAAAYASAFAPDLRFINPAGVLISGRDACRATHVFLFNGPFAGSTLNLAVREIEFLTGTVAIVYLDLSITGYAFLPPGVPAPSDGVARARATWVVEKVRGEWQVVFAQNTNQACGDGVRSRRRSSVVEVDVPFERPGRSRRPGREIDGGYTAHGERPGCSDESSGPTDDRQSFREAHDTWFGGVRSVAHERDEQLVTIRRGECEGACGRGGRQVRDGRVGHGEAAERRESRPGLSAWGSELARRERRDATSLLIVASLKHR